jgi:hypothetical protein
MSFNLLSLGNFEGMNVGKFVGFIVGTVNATIMKLFSNYRYIYLLKAF